MKLAYETNAPVRLPGLIADASGRIRGINKLRVYENSFFLNTNPPNTQVVVAANATSQATGMRISAEGPVQVTQLGALRDSSHNPVLVLLEIQDGVSVGQLMNNPCHIDTLFGPGGLMYHLTEGLYLDEYRSLAVVFKDISGSDNLVRITAAAAKYTKLRGDPGLDRVGQRLKDRQYLSLPYLYTFDDGKAVLTPLGYAEYEITVVSSGHFLIGQMSFSSTDTFSLDIVDMSKGESIVNGPSATNFLIPHYLMCGDGSYPYRFHEPVMVYAGQKLLVRLQDTSGAANTVYLTLGGSQLKVRRCPPAHRTSRWPYPAAKPRRPNCCRRS